MDVRTDSRCEVPRATRNVAAVSARVSLSRDDTGFVRRGVSCFAEGMLCLPSPPGGSRIPVHAAYAPAGVESWRASQRFAIDAHGNPTAVMDANGHRRKFAYDASGLLLLDEQAEFDDAGHAPYSLRMEVSHHPVLEQITSSTAWMRVEAGNVVSSPRSTAYRYDALGRLAAIAAPGDSLATPTQEFAYELASPVSRILARRRTTSGSATADLEAVQCFDGLGRKFQERIRIEPGRYQVSGNQLFDAHGQVYRQYQAYLGSTGACETAAAPSTVLYSETTRDGAGRTVEVVHPDATDYGGVASVERTVYRPLESDGWDQEDSNVSGRHASTPTTIVRDGLDRVVRTLRRLNTTDAPVAIRTTYDSLGRIRSLIDDAGNEQRQQYDLLGRIARVEHPDSGVTTYEYDDADNRLVRTDARGVATRESFDEANRITSRWDASKATETAIRFRYDGLCANGIAACPNGEGQLVEMTHPLLVGEWARTTIGRDIRGREVVQRVERGTRSYEFAMRYDDADRPIARTYPEGTTIEVLLDGADRPVAIPGYVNEVAYDARGLASRTALANGVDTVRTFDSNQRLRSITTSVPSASDRAQDLAYHWDRAGNLLEVEDFRTVSDDVPTANARYDYDSLYRLTAADLDLGRSRQETISLEYDRIDNLIRNESSLGSRSPAHIGALRYGENGAGPHAVTSVGADAYAYDAAGHVVERIGLHHEWDFLGRLHRSAHVADGEVVVDTAYGVQSDRAQQIGDGHATEFVSPDYEVRDGIATISVMLGARPVARVERAVSAVNELSDLAPASGPIGAETSQPNGQIDVGDAWLKHARDAGLVAVVALTPEPSGPQTEVDVVLHAAAKRRLMGADLKDTTFEHADHLNTTTSETDEAGSIMQRALAFPFGAPRFSDGTGWSRHGFAGMERDSSTGLALHGARFLDSRAGRWVSVDPKYEQIVAPSGEFDDRQGASPYSYALNNPLRWIDSAGTEISDENLGWLGVAFCTVALVATVAVGPIALTAVAVGFVVGVAGEVVHQLVRDGDITSGNDVLEMGLIGGIIGGATAIASLFVVAIEAGMTVGESLTALGTGVVTGALAGAVEEPQVPEWQLRGATSDELELAEQEDRRTRAEARAHPDPQPYADDRQPESVPPEFAPPGNGGTIAPEAGGFYINGERQ